MLARTCILLGAWLLAFSYPALGDAPEGKFSVVNTAGFVEQGGTRQPLTVHQPAISVHIAQLEDGSLGIVLGEADLKLYPVAGGLAALDWDASGSTLLHETDIEAILNIQDRSAVPVWGAELAWPGTGLAQMVMMPLGDAAYTGFLISKAEGKTIVRQMEFQQSYGPNSRP